MIDAVKDDDDDGRCFWFCIEQMNESESDSFDSIATRRERTSEMGKERKRRDGDERDPSNVRDDEDGGMRAHALRV